MPLKVGGTSYSAVKVGEDNIVEAYLGGDRVFSSAAPIVPEWAGNKQMFNLATGVNSATDVAIGTPPSTGVTRTVFLFIAYFSSNTLSSASIAGVSATLVDKITIASTRNLYVFKAEVPAGAGEFATVTVTASGFIGTVYLMLFATRGGVPQLIDTAKNSALVDYSPFTSTSLDLPVDYVDGGAILAVVAHIGSNAVSPDVKPWTWTNLTEKFDVEVTSNFLQVSGACQQMTASGLNRPINVATTSNYSAAQGTRYIPAIALSFAPG